jgi:hypothetical protein
MCMVTKRTHLLLRHVPAGNRCLLLRLLQFCHWHIGAVVAAAAAAAEPLEAHLQACSSSCSAANSTAASTSCTGSPRPAGLL